jgi:hypothetical protein
MAFFGAFGAMAAARSFRRTGDADRRWLITTRWATLGFIVGVAVVFFHETFGVP